MARPREYDDGLRVRLLEVAAALLATEGPHALSLRRIAADAGTSTAAIYSLLGGKEGLVREMVLEGFRRLERAMAEAEPGEDALDHLGELGITYHRNAVRNPHLYRIMFDPPVPGFTLDEHDAAYALSTLGTLVDAVRAAVAAGLVDGPADHVALELWAMGHGVATLAISGMLGTAEQAEAHLARLGAATLAGYRAQAGASASR